MVNTWMIIIQKTVYATTKDFFPCKYTTVDTKNEFIRQVLKGRIFQYCEYHYLQ